MLKAPSKDGSINRDHWQSVRAFTQYANSGGICHTLESQHADALKTNEINSRPIHQKKGINFSERNHGW